MSIYYANTDYRIFFDVTSSYEPICCSQKYRDEEVIYRQVLHKPVREDDLFARFMFLNDSHFYD